MLAWDDLKFVLALSRHGTATAAAKVLGVNATTVTRRIQALEEHLGTRLFDRRAHGTVPTEAGQAAVAVAERMEDDVHGLDAEIRGLDEELRGKLRVTSLDMFFELWREDLRAFSHRFPAVNLTLSSGTRWVDLSRREADVAVRLAVSPPEHLVGRKLVEVFYAVYASDDLVARITNGRDPASVAYAEYPWIGWEAPFAEATERVIARYAPGAAMPVRVSSMKLLERCLEDGLGISVAHCLLGDPNPRLVRLGPYFEGGTHLWVLTHEQLRHTARIRGFIDFVAKLAERDAELLQGRAPSRPTVPAAVPDGVAP